MSGGKFDVQNVQFTDSLSRPGTSLGAILSSSVTGDFIPVAPTSDFQVLTSNSATSAGVEWQVSVINAGFGFVQNELSGIGTDYFLIDSLTRPIPLVLPNSKAIFMSVKVNDSLIGWSEDPTRFNSGSIEFSIGYVPANTPNITANWTAYTGSPHLSIQYTDINSVPNQFRSFTVTLDIPILAGQQVSIERVSTLGTSSGPPISLGDYGVFLLCVGT